MNVAVRLIQGLLGLTLAACATAPAHEAPSASRLDDLCRALKPGEPTPAAFQRGARFQGPVVFVGSGGELCLDPRPDPPLRSLNDPRVTPDQAAAFVRVQVAGVSLPASGAAAAEAEQVLTMGLAGTALSCRVQGRRGTTVLADCDRSGEPLAESLRRAGVLN